MTTIDGSKGEGGGQILRTSLALSLIAGRPFSVVNIRAGRKKPGLMRQHLTAVLAAADVGDAVVEGAGLGSREFSFAPRGVKSGAYHFDIGSAGSATLVLQTVLPPLLTASGPTDLVLEGGTHNPLAPPYEFLTGAFLPIVNRMGPTVSASLVRHGFYPAGGGRIEVHIEPAARLNGLELNERGPITHRRGSVLLANLPMHIAEREIRTLQKKLSWPPKCFAIEPVASDGPGNAVVVEVATAETAEVATAFGKIGVKAEDVASRAARDIRRFLEAEVPVGEHLADQLLVPLALAGQGSFTSTTPTSHMLTNIEIIEQFCDIRFHVEHLQADRWQVTVSQH